MPTRCWRRAVCDSSASSTRGARRNPRRRPIGFARYTEAYWASAGPTERSGSDQSGSPTAPDCPRVLGPARWTKERDAKAGKGVSALSYSPRRLPGRSHLRRRCRHGHLPHHSLRDRETQTVVGYFNGAWTTDPRRSLALGRREAAEAHAARMRTIAVRATPTSSRSRSLPPPTKDFSRPVLLYLARCGRRNRLCQTNLSWI